MVLITTDVHQRAGQPYHPSYYMVKRFAADLKPDIHLDLGDWFEFEYLASFNRENLKKLTSGTFAADYEQAEQELDFWQSVTEECIRLQGNHERRVERLVENKPLLEGLVEPEVVLGYKDKGVTWKRQEDQPVRIRNWWFLHGVYANKHHAIRNLQSYMENVCYGHTHSEQSDSLRRPLDGKWIKAQSLGCLCEIQPEWRHGMPTDHMNGFGIMDEDTLYPVGIYNGAFTWDGEKYTLTEWERKLGRMTS